MTLWWRDDIESAAIRFIWFTVLKAFDRSIAIAIVRRGGSRGLLKPVVTLCASGSRAEVVDLCFQKPCWVSNKFRSRLRYGLILLIYFHLRPHLLTLSINVGRKQKFSKNF